MNVGCGQEEQGNIQLRFWVSSTVHSCTLPLQDGLGGMVSTIDVTAHAPSENLNSVFRQLNC